MSERSYNVTIKESSYVLSSLEKIMVKDLSDAVKLDARTQEGELIIEPMSWVVLDIHNEKSETVDYSVYVIIDSTGARYYTGSESFWNSFRDIFDELDGDESAKGDWALKIYRLPSKNRQGKDFITCSVVAK